MVKPLNLKLWRDVRRHRAQFAAIAITMFLGVTIFGATYDSFQNLQASYDRTATEFRFANLTIVGGDTERIDAAALQLRPSNRPPFAPHPTSPFRLARLSCSGGPLACRSQDSPQSTNSRS